MNNKCVVCNGAISASTEQEYESLCLEHRVQNDRNIAEIEKARYESEHDL